VTVMLYRSAETPNPQVWDWLVEHKVFAEADVPIALSEGWVRHPSDVSLEPQAEAEIVQLAKRRGRPPKEG
jgi:hypothetical protein